MSDGGLGDAVERARRRRAEDEKQARAEGERREADEQHVDELAAKLSAAVGAFIAAMRREQVAPRLLDVGWEWHEEKAGLFGHKTRRRRVSIGRGGWLVELRHWRTVDGAEGDHLTAVLDDASICDDVVGKMAPGAAIFDARAYAKRNLERGVDELISKLGRRLLEPHDEPGRT